MISKVISGFLHRKFMYPLRFLYACCEKRLLEFIVRVLIAESIAETQSKR